MSKDLVLVVDDELDNRVMMRYFLESWGYEVVLAANGEEALSRVAEQAPALVLLDLEMPVMDGFETCHRLKENPQTEDIPVIMFTGLEATADKVKGIRRGADDYVVKTVDPEEIQARIEMILRRSKRVQEKAVQTAQAAPAAAAPASSAVITGSLEEKHFPEAMQLALAYGQSGVFRIEADGEEAKVFIHEGNVAHAVCGQTEGIDAFYEMALWRTGFFSYHVGETPSERTIQQSGTSLLMEATRRLDEWNMISGKIPDFDVVPHRVAIVEAKSIRLTTEDWTVLRLVDSQRSIRDIVNELGCDLFEVGRTVFGLLTVGVLALEEHIMKKTAFYEAIPHLGQEPKESDPFELSSNEWALVSYIDGERDLGTVALMSGVPPHALAASLKSLSDRGLVRLLAAPKASAKVQPIPTSPQPRMQASAGNMETFQPQVRAMGAD